MSRLVILLCLLGMTSACRTRWTDRDADDDHTFVDDAEIFAMDLYSTPRRVAIWKRSKARQLCGVLVVEQLPGAAQGITIPSSWSLVHIGFGATINDYEDCDHDTLPAWGGSGVGEIAFLDEDRNWGPCRLRVDVDVAPALAMPGATRPQNLQPTESFVADQIGISGVICNP